MSALVGLLDSVAVAGRAEPARPPATRLLHGLGGCGKTSVALELAHRAVAKGVQVWWIDRTDQAALAGAMRAVGRRLGLSDDQVRLDEFPDLLWERLNAHPEPWLLLLDGVDDPEWLAIDYPFADGRGWVRPLGADARGVVVVTSRNGNPQMWGRWWTRHPVGVLDTVAGGQVLLDHADAGTTDEARSLARRLGGLGLALHLAGAYLARTTSALLDDPGEVSTFVDYRARLDDGDLELLDVENASDPADEDGRSERIISRVWELSLDLIERRGQPGARALLRLLACFASTDVPYRLLLETSALTDAPVFAGQNMAGIAKMLGALVDFGLVDVSASPKRGALTDGTVVPAVLRMHPLVRDTSRSHLEQAGELAAYVSLACALLASAVSDCGAPDDSHSWPAWQTLAPHCAQLLDVASTAPLCDNLSAAAIDQATGAASEAARYLYARGLYTQAADLFRALTAIRQQLTSDDVAAILQSRNLYAGALRDDAQARADKALLREAEEELRAVYESQRVALGDEHDDTLETLCDLAIAIAYQNRPAEAKQLYELAYEMCTAKLGEHHRLTLNCRHGLAVRLWEERKWDDAEREFRAVYELSRELPERGPDHPETLGPRAWLASVLQSRGELAEAEAEYRSLVDVNTRLNRADHPNTLSVRRSLASVLRERGALVEAEAEYRALVAIYTRVYGADDKVTLGSRSGLAFVLRQRGLLADSEREYRILVEKFAQAYGAEDKATLGVRFSFAMVLRAQGELAAAQPYFESVVDADVRVYGAEDAVTLYARGALAALLYERRELADAEREYRAILDILGRMSNPGDNLIATRMSLAVVLAEKGRQIRHSAESPEQKGDGVVSDNDDLVAGPPWFTAAMAAFQEALSLVDPEQRPGIYGVVLHDIAAAYAAAGNLTAAVESYQESARHKRRADNKGDLQATLRALADSLISVGDLAEARTVLDEAREILADTTLARRSIRLYYLGQSYEMLGGAGGAGAYDQALATYVEARELLDVESEWGSYATVSHGIGDVYLAMDRVPDAVAAYREAVDHLRRHAAGDDHLRSFLVDLGRALVRLGESEIGDAPLGDGETADYAS